MAMARIDAENAATPFSPYRWYSALGVTTNTHGSLQQRTTNLPRHLHVTHPPPFDSCLKSPPKNNWWEMAGTGGGIFPEDRFSGTYDVRGVFLSLLIRPLHIMLVCYT